MTKENGYYHLGSDVIFCRRCKSKYRGETFVYEKRSVDSIERDDDGTYKQAHRIVWVCDNNRSHIQHAGYTRPVDFNLNFERRGS